MRYLEVEGLAMKTKQVSTRAESQGLLISAPLGHLTSVNFLAQDGQPPPVPYFTTDEQHLPWFCLSNCLLTQTEESLKVEV